MDLLNYPYIYKYVFPFLKKKKEKKVYISFWYSLSSLTLYEK